LFFFPVSAPVSLRIFSAFSHNSTKRRKRTRGVCRGEGRILPVLKPSTTKQRNKNEENASIKKEKNNRYRGSKGKMLREDIYGRRRRRRRK